LEFFDYKKSEKNKNKMPKSKSKKRKRQRTVKPGIEENNISDTFANAWNIFGSNGGFEIICENNLAEPKIIKQNNENNSSERKKKKRKLTVTQVNTPSEKTKRKKYSRKKKIKDPRKESSYRGVSWNEVHSRWRVVLSTPEGNRVLGIFPYHLEVQCAELVDLAALKIKQERKNFKNKGEYKKALKNYNRKIPIEFQGQNVALILRWGKKMFTEKEMKKIFYKSSKNSNLSKTK
jgi:hypothetical protein